MRALSCCTIALLLACLLGACAGPTPAATYSSLTAADHARALQLTDAAQRAEVAEDVAATVRASSQAIDFIERRAGWADPMLARPLSMRALALEMQGRADAAHADLDRLLTVTRAYRDPSRLAVAHVQLARLLADRDDGRRDAVAARAHFAQALRLLDAGDRTGGTASLHVLIQYAGFAFALDDRPLWRTLLDRAQTQMLRMATVHDADRAEVASAEALYAWRSGDLLAAVDWGRRAVALTDSRVFDGDRRREVLLQRHLGLLTWLGLLDEAAEGWRQVLARAVMAVETSPETLDAEAVNLATSFVLGAGDVEIRARRTDAARAHAVRAEALIERGAQRVRPVWRRALLRLQTDIAEQDDDPRALEPLLRRLLATGTACEDTDARYAAVLDRLGRRREADTWAAAAWRDLPRRCDEAAASTLLHLARLHAGRGERALAILLGKLSIERVGRLRAQLAGLDAGTRRAFAVAHEHGYYLLAGWLAGEGRLDESQQVLDLLKQREVDLYTRGEGGDARGLSLTPAEDRARVDLASRGAPALRAARAALQAEQAARAVGRAPPLAGALSLAPRAAVPLEPGDLLVSLWQTPGHLHALLRRAGGGGGSSVQVALSTDETRRQILQLRAALGAARDPALRAGADDSRVRLQALYRRLWLPVQQVVDQGEPPRRVLLSLHGPLRFVPFAALHDGQRHLVERWPLLVLTAPRERESVAARPAGLARLAAYAAPDGAPGLAPLPLSAREVDAVVRAAGGETAGARKFVGRDFDRERLFGGLQRHGQIHIASHFRLAPGDGSYSYLLLGDGTRAAAIEFAERALTHVGVLVLAACDAAVPPDGVYGSGQEVESFAALLGRRGVGTVVGAIDAVEDGASAALMSALYPLPVDASARQVADALQRAQLRLLRGEGDARHAHPVFWGPWVALSNAQR